MALHQQAFGTIRETWRERDGTTTYVVNLDFREVEYLRHSRNGEIAAPRIRAGSPTNHGTRRHRLARAADNLFRSGANNAEIR